MEISHMTRHSSKPNKLRNVNPVKGIYSAWQKTGFYIFLLCFSMKYRDFSVKSKPIISLLQTMKIRLLDFHCLGLHVWLLYFMNSRLKVLPKRFQYSILVWNYGDDVNVPRSNRWHNLLCLRNAFSARDVKWTVTDCGIFLRRFYGFITLSDALSYYDKIRSYTEKKIKYPLYRSSSTVFCRTKTRYIKFCILQNLIIFYIGSHLECHAGNLSHHQKLISLLFSIVEASAWPSG